MSYSLMMQHREAGRQKCREGHYTEAEQLFKMALKEAEQFSSPSAYEAQQIKTLGVLYFALGRYEEAEPLFRRSLEIEKALLGPSDLEIAKSMNHLGLLYHIHGYLPQAEKAYKQALDIVEKAPYLRQPSVDAKLHHLSLHLLAMVYCSEGRQNEAYDLCRQASGQIVQNSGPGGCDLSMGIHDVAVKFCDNDPNPEVRKTCGWLLHVFGEQLQTEYLGCTIERDGLKYREFQPQKGMFAATHELLATYEDVWRPAAIYRDEVLPAGFKQSQSSRALRSTVMDSRLSETGGEDWRP